MMGAVSVPLSGKGQTQFQGIPHCFQGTGPNSDVPWARCPLKLHLASHPEIPFEHGPSSGKLQASTLIQNLHGLLGVLSSVC